VTSFLIEFRLHGYAKRYAKWARTLISREARRLGMRRLKQPRFVPHITMFGGARTNNLRRVTAEVARVTRKYTLVPFRLGIRRGEFQNEDACWLYLEVEPSPAMEQLRYELAQSLLRLEDKISRTCQSYDRGIRYKFHCSILKCDPRDRAKFERLAEYAETKCSLEHFKQHRASFLDRIFRAIKKYLIGPGEDDPGVNQHLLRITVLGKGGRIHAEYDLALKRLLSRRQSLSRYWWRRSIEALRTELSPLREDWMSLHDASKCYFIADTHFDHKSTIIKFIHRPFSNTAEMNEAIKNNWNKSVGENDRVYFLGDYTGPPPRKLWMYHEKLRYWTGQLKGMKISILGNHDRNGGCIEFEKARILHIDQRRFLLIHDPADKKIETLRGRYDWIIHGHVHNNKMDRYPFINGEQKTINVSAEVISYKPVSLGCLLLLDLDSIKRMRTIDSQPERW